MFFSETRCMQYATGYGVLECLPRLVQHDGTMTIIVSICAHLPFSIDRTN